jgi:hypothetical protein
MRDRKNTRSLGVVGLVLLLSLVGVLVVSSSQASGILGLADVTTPGLQTTTTFSPTSTTTISTTVTTTSTSIMTSSTTKSTTNTSLSLSFSYTTTVSSTSTSTTTSTVYTSTETQTATSYTGTPSTTYSVITTKTTVLPGIGCPVAFATSGTPLEPYANFLRGFRNNEIQNTTAGSMFMQAFNTWYYGWAPSLTYAAVTQPVVLSLLRAGVYPLIAILYAAYFSYAAVAPLSAEAGALTAGVVAASLIGLVYVAPVAYVSMRLVRRMKFLRVGKAHLLPASGWVGASALMVGAAYLSGSAWLMGLGTASLTLSMLSIGGFLSALALNSIQIPVPNLHAMVFAFRRNARPLH